MYDETVRLIASIDKRKPSDALPSRLDALFRQLALAPHDTEALEDAIWTIWMYHPHRQAARAIDQAATDIAAQRYDIAETRLATLIRARPDFPEAWHKRATLHYLRQDDAESVLDLHHTLELEPRHYPAMMAFGEICLSRKDPEAAIIAFNAARKIHPALAAIQDGLQRAQELVE